MAPTKAMKSPTKGKAMKAMKSPTTAAKVTKQADNAMPTKGKAMKAMASPMKAMKAMKVMKAAMKAAKPPKEAPMQAVTTEAKPMSKGTPPEHSFKTWYFTSRGGWSLSRLEVDIQNKAVHETWMRDPPAAE